MQAVSQRPILIVEDDRNVTSLLRAYLEREGFSVAVRADGREGLAAARALNPILVLLDLRLPSLDGKALCRELRRTSDVLIIMLTACLDEADRIEGFRAGADDYVVKPFSPREVVERVRARLRRQSGAEEVRAVDGQADLHADGLFLSPERASVTLDGAPVLLTLSEFRILHVLMRSPGRVFSREELIEKLHAGGADVVDRIVDVHIGNLRKKIEANPAAPERIITVRGLGYRFQDKVR